MNKVNTSCEFYEKHSEVSILKYEQWMKVLRKIWQLITAYWNLINF